MPPYPLNRAMAVPAAGGLVSLASEILTNTLSREEKNTTLPLDFSRISMPQLTCSRYFASLLISNFFEKNNEKRPREFVRL
jgi:hypothetical protein